MQNKVEILYSVFDRAKELLANNEALDQTFNNLAKQFEDKQQHPDSTIIVYGVYNAGKSTLINALRGCDDAPMGDCPVTDTVTPYKWRNYIIYDTPGIDAPIEHEQVTQEKLHEADIVIFVMNPVGIAEERKTFKVMSDLMLQGKKICVVLNPKDPEFDDAVFINLKDQMRSIMQDMVSPEFTSEVIKFPILKVFAKRALQGRLEHKERLVELSEILDFEEGLINFLESTTEDDIYQRLSIELDKILNDFIRLTHDKQSSASAQMYSKMLNTFLINKGECKIAVDSSIESESNAVYIHCKEKLLKDKSLSEDDLSSFFNLAIDNIRVPLERGILNIKSNLITDLERYNELLTDSPDLHINKDDLINVSCADDEQSQEKSNNPFDNFDLEKIFQKDGGAPAFKKEELDVWVNQIESFIKSIFPNLFKNLPVRPVIEGIVSFVGGLLGNNKEDEEFKRLSGEVAKSQAQEQARQRFNQEVEDLCLQIKNKFKQSMKEQVNLTFTQIDEMQSKLEQDLKQTKEQADNDSNALNEAIRIKHLIPRFK